MSDRPTMLPRGAVVECFRIQGRIEVWSSGPEGGPQGVVLAVPIYLDHAPLTLALTIDEAEDLWGSLALALGRKS